MSEPSPKVGCGGRSFVAVAAAIVALALFLRVYQVGTQDLWLDETVSFHIAVLESGLGDVLLNQNTPPLYYLLLRHSQICAKHLRVKLKLNSIK